MIRVAILSFSDGREKVHQSLKGYIQECADKMELALTSTGEVTVVAKPSIVCSNGTAKDEAVKLPADIDACILNVCVFSFPNFALLAAQLTHVPLLAIAPRNGAYPGLGGLQAAVNLIHQTGGQCEKVWGNIAEDNETLDKVMAFLRASSAVTRLRGQVLGLMGGRSIGMGSGAVNPDLWLHKFGVDVDHIDQLEIIRRAQLITDSQTDYALKWLEDNMGEIRYDGDKLTPDTLRMQIKCHMAIKQLIAERSLSFVAVKCHYELSEYYVSQCLSAALTNDPYDWDGPKEPMVFSCEADCDAALTMQVMRLITGKPVLFMDFRHYLEQENVFAFCNCGACATWYAKRSPIPKDNMSAVRLLPLIPKYAGGGCHVQFLAAPGTMTFARLSRVMEGYKLQAFLGDVKSLPEKLTGLTCPAWPHAFTRVQSNPLELVMRFESNHIHAVEGDYLEELRLFCQLKDIVFEVL